MGEKSTTERLDGQKRAIVSLRERMKSVEDDNRLLKSQVAALMRIAGVPDGVLHIPDDMPEVPVSSVIATAVPVSGNTYSLPVLTLDLARGEKAKQWVPTPLCLACGNHKEPNRETNLTCKACGTIRHKQVSGTWDKPEVKYSGCGHCGCQRPKGGLDPVCGRCRYLFSQWKKNQPQS